MKKRIFENMGLKISAVLLSVFLWLFVTSRGQTEISLEVPLEYKNVPQELGLVNNSTKMVVVSLRGQERLIKSIRPSEVRAFLDLSKAKKGEGVYYIGRDDIRLPYAVSVVHVEPSSVKVTLDETVSEIVAVRPIIRGQPQPGFFVKSIEVYPRTMEISGLKTEVRRIRQVKTEPLDISGIRADLSQELEVDTGASHVKPEQSTVTVKVLIGANAR